MKIQTLIMASLAAFAVQADYVTLIASDLGQSSSGNDYHSSLVDSWNTQHWSNKEKLSSAYDYYIGTDVFACTPNIPNDTGTHTFVGKSLTLDGGVDGVVVKHYSQSTSTMDFGAASVYLKSGVYEFVNDGAYLKMNAVVQSPESAPFTFCCDYQTWFVNRILTLNLAGESGTAVRLTVDKPETSSMMQWLVTTDSLNYRGVLEVVASPLVVRASDTFKFGGTLRLAEGGSFKANKALTKSVDAPIGRLDLAGGKLTVTQYNPIMVGALVGKGGTVEFDAFHCAHTTPQNYGSLIVNETLALDENAKVNVVIGGGDTLALNSAQAAGEFQLMKFPAGAAVSTDNFKLVLNAKADGFTAEQLSFKWGLAIKDDGGCPALYAVRKKIVLSQDSSYSDHNINDGSKWQDGGAAPHSGATYLAFGSTGKLIVTDADSKFAGDQLVNYANTVRLQTSEFEIPLWTQISGGSGNSIYTEKSSVVIKGGQVEVLPSANETRTTFVDYNGIESALTIESDLVGTGEVAFNQYGRSTDAKLKTVTLSGDNSGFTGRMSLNGLMDVNVASGAAFGGARPSVEYDAVQFTKCTNGSADKYYTIASTENDLDFCEPTRGWMVKDRISFLPAAGKTIAVQAPITLDGGQKYFMGGDGVLAIKELRFTNEPATTDYYIWVNNGFVKPLSADAFNGTRLRFAEGTGVVLDWNAEGDLLKYGLRSTRTIANQNYRMEAVDGQFTISFDMNGKTELTSEDKNSIHGLITVPTAEADKWYKNIKVLKPFRGTNVLVTRKDNEDSTTTFSAQVTRSGLFFAIK